MYWKVELGKFLLVLPHLLLPPFKCNKILHRWYFLHESNANNDLCGSLQCKGSLFLPFLILLLFFRRYMAEVLPIQHKTLNSQSINLPVHILLLLSIIIITLLFIDYITWYIIYMGNTIHVHLHVMHHFLIYDVLYLAYN